MIGTLLRSQWINLKRDRVAQSMTFLLPIIFFSIFAMVFGSQRNPTQKVQVAVVNEDHSDYTKRLVQALAAEGGLDVRTTKGDNGAGGPLDRASAEALVRGGTLPVAVILPKGLGAAPALWGDGARDRASVDLLTDVSDPVAPQMVQGLLEKVSFTAAPELLARQGIEHFQQYAGGLTETQQRLVDRWFATLQSSAGQGASAGGGGAIGLPIHLVNVMQPNQGNTATISFYAAGVGVMFLLFSCAGAGGSLLDEEESGTLGRLVGSRAGMGGVLAGKWVFLTLMGMTQLSIMFLWGALVFHLPLASHVPGFVLMTVVTASAAAAFGLVLATLSRSRQQLSGIGTILILTMSALGGSMFPRFLMSPTLQKVGLVTFNAWALDGYVAVFWRDARLVTLWPQVLVLTLLTVVFLGSSRMLARRWETL